MDDLTAPEHSLVTVMVVDIVGSTRLIRGMELDDAQPLLDAVMEHVIRHTQACGGILANFHGDGGVAIFGWPNALEDHADLACEAAWNIQHSPLPPEVSKMARGQDVKLRIGIHSGRIKLRHIKMATGSQFDPVGDTIHFAAALEKAAGAGNVLISSATRHLCRTELALEQRILDAKDDQPQPFETYLLTEAPKNDRTRDGAIGLLGEIVGRDTELATATHAILSTENTTRSLAIIGEPGVGKSRLMEEAISRASVHRPDMRVIRVHCETRFRSVPFYAIRSLIEKLQTGHAPEARAALDTEAKAALEIISGGDAEASRRTTLTLLQLARAVGRALAQLARLPDTTVIVERPGTAEIQPLLLAVEDIQWCDPESRQCLAQIRPASSGDWPALVITSRPESRHDVFSITGKSINLGPLTRDASREMADRLWTSSRLDRSLLPNAIALAEGVPFVLEQIFLSAKQGLIAGASPIPDRVESLIHSRLHLLSPKAKELAQIASTLGGTVETAVLAEIANAGEGGIGPVLDELGNYAFIVRPSGRDLRFRHQIIADACATTVPRPRRSAIHRSAIRVVYSELDDHFERLAGHAEQSGDPIQALDYLWSAAKRARRTGAAKSLEAIFNRAMTCTDQAGAEADSRFVDFVLAANLPLLHRGELGRMRPLLQRAGEIAERLKQTDRQGSALANLAYISWFEGRFVEGFEQAAVARAIAGKSQSLPYVFASNYVEACLRHAVGEVRSAIELMETTKAMFVGVPEGARLGAVGLPSSVMRSFLAWMLIDIAEFDRARSNLEEGRELSRKHSCQYSGMLICLGFGHLHLANGDNPAAITELKEAQRICNELGFDLPLPHVLGLLVTATARNSHPEVAVAIAEELLEKSSLNRTGQYEYYYLQTGYCEALARLDMHEEALEVADGIIKNVRRIGAPILLANTLGLRAALLACKPEYRPASKDDLAEQSDICTRLKIVRREFDFSPAA